MQVGKYSGCNKRSDFDRKMGTTLLNLILKHNVNNDRKFHRDIKDANTFSQELRKHLKTKYYLSCTLNIVLWR